MEEHFQRPAVAGVRPGVAPPRADGDAGRQQSRSCRRRLRLARGPPPPGRRPGRRRRCAPGDQRRRFGATAPVLTRRQHPRVPVRPRRGRSLPAVPAPHRSPRRGQPRERHPGHRRALPWSPDGTQLLLGVAGLGADLSGGQGSGTTYKPDEQLPDWMPQVDERCQRRGLAVAVAVDLTSPTARRSPRGRQRVGDHVARRRRDPRRHVAATRRGRLVHRGPEPHRPRRHRVDGRTSTLPEGEVAARAPRRHAERCAPGRRRGRLQRPLGRGGRPARRRPGAARARRHRPAST